MKPPLFALGQVVSTPGALDAMAKAGQDSLALLQRHLTGDWGDICKEDKEVNDAAVRDGERIFSSYKLNDNTKIWVITEWDRSVTTFLLPEDY